MKKNKITNPFNIPDPDFSKQVKKYENPIPSRKALLAFLTSQDTILKIEKIASKIGITNDLQMEGLKRRLNAMIHDGSLFINRKNGYGVRDKTDLIKGVVSAHADGFGFCDKRRKKIIDIVLDDFDIDPLLGCQFGLG